VSPIASYARPSGHLGICTRRSERGRGGGCGRPEMRSSLAGSKPVPLLPKRSLADRIPSLVANPGGSGPVAAGSEGVEGHVCARSYSMTAVPFGITPAMNSPTTLVAGPQKVDTK
jgi:hypothetical protein